MYLKEEKSSSFINCNQSVGLKQRWNKFLQGSITGKEKTVSEEKYLQNSFLAVPFQKLWLAEEVQNRLGAQGAAGSGYGNRHA